MGHARSTFLRYRAISLCVLIILFLIASAYRNHERQRFFLWIYELPLSPEYLYLVLSYSTCTIHVRDHFIPLSPNAYESVSFTLSSAISRPDSLTLLLSLSSRDPMLSSITRMTKTPKTPWKPSKGKIWAAELLTSVSSPLNLQALKEWSK